MLAERRALYHDIGIGNFAVRDAVDQASLRYEYDQDKTQSMYNKRHSFYWNTTSSPQQCGDCYVLVAC